MKNKIQRFFLVGIIMIGGLLFVAKFAGGRLLRLYIETGIGTCKTIPVLCLAPSQSFINPEIDKDYISELITYEFPEMRVSVPKKFIITKQRITKAYYKKYAQRSVGSIIYLLYEPPNFFISLFPQVKNFGIKNNYDFLYNVMHAKVGEINGIKDAFFSIMKGIFIPDLGKQADVKMAIFTISDKRGFLNYNLGEKENYFDCNVVDSQGNFFKIYIKDKGKILDIEKVLSIVSTTSNLTLK